MLKVGLCIFLMCDYSHKLLKYCFSIALHQKVLILKIGKHLFGLILFVPVTSSLCVAPIRFSVVMAARKPQGKAAKYLKKRREQRRLERAAANSSKESSNPIVSVIHSFSNVTADIEARNSSVASNAEAPVHQEETATPNVARANNANGDRNSSVVGSGSCSCERGLSPSVAKFSAALPALDNDSAVVEAPTSAEHTNQAALEAIHPRSETNTSHLSPLKPTRIFEPSTAKLSPESKSLVEAFENKLKRTPVAKQRLLFSGVKEVFIRNDQPLPLPKVAPTGPSLDMNAFNFIAPNTRGIPKARWGKSREEYSATIATKSNGTTLDAATQVRRHAVLRIVDALHAAGGEDQRALALYHFLNHYKIRDYVGRMYRSFVSESMQIGLHALNGMHELVWLITEGTNAQGRSRQCRAFLQLIAMCLTKGADGPDSVSQRSIFRNMCGSLGLRETQRLMETAGKKRKRMEEESFGGFQSSRGRGQKE